MNTVTLLLMFGVAVKYCYFVLQLHKNFIWAFIRIQPLTLSVFCFFCLLFFFFIYLIMVMMLINRREIYQRKTPFVSNRDSDEKKKYIQCYMWTHYLAIFNKREQFLYRSHTSSY